MKPWAILCCGCHRMMGTDGKPFGEPQVGAINLGHLYKRYEGEEKRVASFDSKEGADIAARGFGWSAIDGNHRCPDCDAQTAAGSQYAPTYQHGAYIPWPVPASEPCGSLAASPEAK